MIMLDKYPKALTPDCKEWIFFIQTLNSLLADKQCNTTDYRPLTVKALETVGYDKMGQIEDSLNLFEQCCGLCDCMVLLNVQGVWQAKKKEYVEKVKKQAKKEKAKTGVDFIKQYIQ